MDPKKLAALKKLAEDFPDDHVIHEYYEIIQGIDKMDSSGHPHLDAIVEYLKIDAEAQLQKILDLFIEAENSDMLPGTAGPDESDDTESEFDDSKTDSESSSRYVAYNPEDETDPRITQVEDECERLARIFTTLKTEKPMEKITAALDGIVEAFSIDEEKEAIDAVEPIRIQFKNIPFRLLAQGKEAEQPGLLATLVLELHHKSQIFEIMSQTLTAELQKVKKNKTASEKITTHFAKLFEIYVRHFSKDADVLLKEIQSADVNQHKLTITAGSFFNPSPTKLAASANQQATVSKALEGLQKSWESEAKAEERPRAPSH